MAEKEQPPTYSALVRQIVQDSLEPLAFAEIFHRVEQVRRIETRSPENTIRNAISQCYLIVNNGKGKYGWYPRLLKDSYVRVPLFASDLKHQRVIIDDESRELLWPGFFAGNDAAYREPVTICFPDNSNTQVPLQHF